MWRSTSSFRPGRAIATPKSLHGLSRRWKSPGLYPPSGRTPAGSTMRKLSARSGRLHWRHRAMATRRARCWATFPTRGIVWLENSASSFWERRSEGSIRGTVGRVLAWWAAMRFAAGSPRSIDVESTCICQRSRGVRRRRPPRARCMSRLAPAIAFVRFAPSTRQVLSREGRRPVCWPADEWLATNAIARTSRPGRVQRRRSACRVARRPRLSAVARCRVGLADRDARDRGEAFGLGSGAACGPCCAARVEVQGRWERSSQGTRTRDRPRRTGVGPVSGAARRSR